MEFRLPLAKASLNEGQTQSEASNVRNSKYVLAAVAIISIMALAFYAYPTQNKAPTVTSAFAPGPSDISYPNPIAQNVTVMGSMTASIVSPACALSSPPCAISDSPLYYITVGGWNYRLIFPNSTKIPLNHARIVVTGIFVTPSTYKADQWLPQMYFRGDIYVITYSYVSPY